MDARSDLRAVLLAVAPGESVSADDLAARVAEPNAHAMGLRGVVDAIARGLLDRDPARPSHATLSARGALARGLDSQQGVALSEALSRALALPVACPVPRAELAAVGDEALAHLAALGVIARGPAPGVPDACVLLPGQRGASVGDLLSRARGWSATAEPEPRATAEPEPEPRATDGLDLATLAAEGAPRRQLAYLRDRHALDLSQKPAQVEAALFRLTSGAIHREEEGIIFAGRTKRDAARTLGDDAFRAAITALRTR